MYERVIKTKEEYVDEYINLLNDFCILRKNAHKQTQQVRDILMKCPDEFAMSNKTRDLRIGNETLAEFINRN